MGIFDGIWNISLFPDQCSKCHNLCGNIAGDAHSLGLWVLGSHLWESFLPKFRQTNVEGASDMPIFVRWHWRYPGLDCFYELLGLKIAPFPAEWYPTDVETAELPKTAELHATPLAYINLLWHHRRQAIDTWDGVWLTTASRTHYMQPRCGIHAHCVGRPCKRTGHPEAQCGQCQGRHNWRFRH